MMEAAARSIKASPVTISTACEVSRQVCVKQDPRLAIRFTSLLFRPVEKCSFLAGVSDTTAGRNGIDRGNARKSLGCTRQSNG
jgi:hypothetical protein